MENKKHIKDDFDLEYENLPITIWVKQYEASRYEPAEYEEQEIDIDYDYSLDEDDVLDYFADHADSYEELKGFETDEEFQKYLEEHVDDLFDKYYDDLKDHFYEKARDAAEDSYDPDDYDNSDW